MNTFGPNIRQRLLTRTVIDPDTGCWLWTGCTDHKGYGRINVVGKNRRAHRVAYQIIEGQIPDGLELDHLCRVRNCINPAHLEPVTGRVNTSRGLSGIANRSKTRCVNGHPFDEENTRRRPNGTRRCRTCNRLRRAESRARARAKRSGLVGES